MATGNAIQSAAGAAGTGTVTSVTAADTSIVAGGTPGVAITLATGTLDVIAAQHPPAAAVAMNSQKITSLANGSAAGDAMAFGQQVQNPGPAANGLLAWSWDICANGSNSGVLVTGGTLYLVAFTLLYATTLSKIWWVNTAAAVSPTAGESQVGIYSSSGSLVASATAAATATAMTGTNGISVSLSSSYPAAAGTYWVGMVFQAGTEPTILRNGNNNTTFLNTGIAAAANYRVCVNGTGITTALPGSITPSSNSLSGGQNLWVGVS